LPLRRSYEEQTYEDGTERTVVVLGEYDRRGWGPGGHDLDWYCTGATEAHIGEQPVYLSSRDELVALLGQPAYDHLVALCQQREELLRDHPKNLGLTPHPADP